jgi:hypothetical protein
MSLDKFVGSASVAMLIGFVMTVIIAGWASIFWHMSQGSVFHWALFLAGAVGTVMLYVDDRAKARAAAGASAGGGGTGGKG